MTKQWLVAVLAGLTMASAASAQMAHSPDSQDLTPPHQVEMYLDGFHNYLGQEHHPKETQLQKRYAHYCKQLSPDMFQCIIYDGNGKDAHLVGTEHVISEKLYKELPSAERKYWHPHDGEVDSGLLRAPGMDSEKEKQTLEFLKHTYGKTWNVWQPDDKLPYGAPRLMWSVQPADVTEKTKKSVAAREVDFHF